MSPANINIHFKRFLQTQGKSIDMLCWNLACLEARSTYFSEGNSIEFLNPRSYEHSILFFFTRGQFFSLLSSTNTQIHIHVTIYGVVCIFSCHSIKNYK